MPTFRKCDECTARYDFAAEYEKYGCVCKRRGWPKRDGPHPVTARTMMLAEMLAGGATASELDMGPEDHLLVAAFRREVEAMKWGAHGE
jgi:hypothetical protein